MEKLLNLQELGSRLKTVDSMLIRLIARRMELAAQVGKFKRQQGEPIFRASVEDKRISDFREEAEKQRINPHFAELILYALINESCKLQMIQLQSEVLDEGRVLNDDDWYDQLKRNLLILTERWHMFYDTHYENAYFATQEYARYEQALLLREIEQLSDREVMLDLGCATGKMSFLLHDKFDRVVGYDISQHMQARATQNAEGRNLQAKVAFECVDLEDGIPMPDSSVSFVVMNLGTASDMRGIAKVIDESLRVLKPGGRFFFSFYNRDALVYRWDFLPWQVDLAAMVNIHRDSLDVHSKNEDSKEEIISVYARAYTKVEIETLFKKPDVADIAHTTYPTVSAILPHELFTGQSDVQVAVTLIDEALAETSMGAYSVVVGQKRL